MNFGFVCVRVGLRSILNTAEASQLSVGTKTANPNKSYQTKPTQIV